MHQEFFIKTLWLLFGLCFFTPLSFANEKAPHLEESWSKFSELKYLNINDFSVERRSIPAVLITFKKREQKVVIFLNDSTEKYSDKKFRMNMTILLSESSSTFQLTPPGAISQDIYFGENFRFPKNEGDLTKIYMDKIIEHLAQSLARNLPGFIWKNKSEAIEGLQQMDVEKKNYLAVIWQYKRRKDKQGGGIMEFEILTNPEKKIVGSRITEELLIDY